ncbi:MAG: DUF3501 family protein [Alphaproteobacteria bacterium]
MTGKHTITRADLMDMAEYGKVRGDRRRAIGDIKRPRRVAVGPHATFYFENFDTMLHQVHEMLFIERGGEAQIEDELQAYNPLIPNGRELVATLMLEYEDPKVRDQALRQLTYVEKTVTLTVAGEEIKAVPESDLERTKDDGKTSSIHFLRFPLSDTQAEAFKTAGTRVVLGIGHENYGHMAVLPEATRAALALDLD